MTKSRAVNLAAIAQRMRDGGISVAEIAEAFRARRKSTGNS